MRALVIDDVARTKANAVKEFALAHRFSIHDMLKRMKFPDSAPGNDPNFVLNLIDGWKVVYSVEQSQAGWFHHISISIDPREKNKPVPSIAGAEEILKLLGLGPVTKHTGCWLEDVQGGKAVNLLFPFVEPKPSS
jgi:hypothetical protein